METGNGGIRARHPAASSALPRLEGRSRRSGGRGRDLPAEWHRLIGKQGLDSESEMLIARSPLRISLGGGGTDLPSYYREHGGFLVAGAITKYVYITLHQTFVPDLIVKYSKLERVLHAKDIEHPIIREAMMLLGIDGRF